MAERKGYGIVSFGVSLLKIFIIALFAVYAKRYSFTRPFYWFVVQLAAIFTGLIVAVLFMAIFALFGCYQSKFAEIICLSLWGLVSLGSISEVVCAMEYIELEIFENIIQLKPLQKVFGFIYGVMMHAFLIYKLF
jgi:hypothetical protein